MPHIDGLRTQSQLHSHIAIRDLPKRFATVQFLHAAMWYAGYQTEAVVNFIVLVVLEGVIYFLNRTGPAVTEISRQRIAASLTLSALVSFCYYIPGVILALDDDFGLAMGGMAWILAAISTNLVMYNALRAYYWSTAVAGLPSALIAVAFIANKDVTPAAEYTWLLPVGIVCLYIVNTLQQLREYRDTHDELEKTRAELLKNLRAMEHMSLHDGLTGLGNRAQFQALLERMLSRAAPGNPLAVFMIDLNGFKPINDTYGHSAGDAVLVTVAARLTGALRPGAVAFRVGGDEFCVLSYGSGAQDFQTIGDRLARDIRAPLSFEGKTLLIGASIGFSVSETAQDDPLKLCAVADHAMYLAKTTKSQTALVGTPEALDNEVDPRCHAQLADALKTGEILPYYQPKYTVDGAKMVGFQALARWVTPDKGVLQSHAFIPDLDSIGMLPDLTLSILRAVLIDLSQWHARGYDTGRISINVPVMSLATESRRQELEWLLAEYAGLEPFLAFEITEDAYIVRSGDVVAAALRHFAELGIEIYLDDFGTGYASYQHLRQITPHEIKIDGSLVAAMAPGSPAMAVIQGIINIAHGVGASVVAENVETEPQRVALSDMGCDYVEGHLFAPALPQKDVQELLDAPPHAVGMKQG